jgi:hypothetical protein
MNLEAGVRPAFPPSLVVQVKALACELPHRQGLPLSRFSIADIRQEVLAQGLVAETYPCSSHRARVRAQGSLGLPRRLGRPTRQNLRSLRTPERDPTL